MSQRTTEVKDNLGLVRWVFERTITYCPWWLDFSDLRQAGALGLMHALRWYNDKKGTLSTYAVPCIRGYILARLHYDEKARAWVEAVRRGYELPRPQPLIIPTDFSGLPAHGEYDDHDWDNLSLITSEAERRAAEELHEEDEVERAHDQAVLKRAVFQLLKQLPSRERHILRRRFWYNWTLQRCGDEYGFSRERARQLEERGLEMLQELCQGRDDLIALMRSAKEEQ